MRRRKIKIAILITVVTLVVIVAVFIACISPIAKYVIEKYDVKFLGREVKIGWLVLNPFTGNVHMGNLKIYEANSDTLFLSAKGCSAGFDIKKALRGTYEINAISLDEPVAYIIQNKKEFNFSDVIERFTPKNKDTIHIKEPVHFNILDIAVSDGEFHYTEQNIPVNYFIKHVNIESPGKRWNVDSMNFTFSLESGPASGKIKGKASLLLDSMRYRVATQIEHFDLKLLEQYLHDMANYGHLSAFLDADLKVAGGLKDQLDLEASGFLQISDIHFGKSKGDDFASVDRVALSAVKINPKMYEYVLDSIMLGHPFFKYERYDHLDNIQRMFGEKGSRIKEAQAASDAGQFNLIIEIAKFVKKIAINFMQSYYAIDKVAIYNGDLRFNDFSLREKFSVAANPLYFLADSLDKDFNRLNAEITTGLKPYGDLRVGLSFNPNNYKNFDVWYTIRRVPVSMFNPYVVSYTSFPLDRGRLDFNGFLKVVDNNIISENHLVIVDPRVAKRVKKKDTKWIPVPLIMSLVRSPGNAIDFELPIRGQLNDPKFKFWPAILTVVRNIFVKPPSSFYLYHVKEVEQEVEKSLTLKWEMRQTGLRPRQEKFVKRVADFLKDNDDATITVTPLQYTEKEKEHILYFEAKKKFFLHTHKMSAKEMTEDDSIAIDKMSVKDSLFVHYLDKQVGDTLLFTVQEKCNVIITKELVTNRFNQLLNSREEVFKSYFGDASGRIKFRNEESTIPFNGFSYYKIDYKGEIPKSLVKAYEELNELDEQPPREKYKEKRKTRLGLITEEREAKRKATTP